MKDCLRGFIDPPEWQIPAPLVPPGRHSRHVIHPSTCIAEPHRDTGIFPGWSRYIPEPCVSNRLVFGTPSRWGSGPQRDEVTSVGSQCHLETGSELDSHPGTPEVKREAGQEK